MHKKAQAAVEFLTTYGWAIIMITVIVGAFAYLGFTDPQRFISDSCTATTGFDCLDVGWVEDTTGGTVYVGIYISNLLANEVQIVADGTFEGDCEATNDIPLIASQTGPLAFSTATSSVTLERDTATLLLFECPEFRSDRAFKLSFEIPFREVRTKFERDLEGEIIIKGVDAVNDYDIS